MNDRDFSLQPRSLHRRFDEAKPHTLVDLLQLRAEIQPDELPYAFLKDGETQKPADDADDLDDEIFHLKELLG